jgi:hypothetical protein
LQIRTYVPALDDRSALRRIRDLLERIGQRRLLIVLDLAAVLGFARVAEPVWPAGRRATASTHLSA